MPTQSRLSPGLFGFVLILFMFPFATFSCMGQDVASLSGLRLATGTTIQQPMPFGQAEQREVPSNKLALLALAAAVAGLGLSLARRRTPAVVAGAVGALALLVMMASITGEVREQAEGAVGVRFTLAYWLAVLSLAGAAVASGRMGAASGDGGGAVAPPAHASLSPPRPEPAGAGAQGTSAPGVLRNP